MWHHQGQVFRPIAWLLVTVSLQACATRAAPQPSQPASVPAGDGPAAPSESQPEPPADAPTGGSTDDVKADKVDRPSEQEWREQEAARFGYPPGTTLVDWVVPRACPVGGRPHYKHFLRVFRECPSDAECFDHPRLFISTILQRTSPEIDEIAEDRVQVESAEFVGSPPCSSSRHEPDVYELRVAKGAERLLYCIWPLNLEEYRVAKLPLEENGLPTTCRGRPRPE